MNIRNKNTQIMQYVRDTLYWLKKIRNVFVVFILYYFTQLPDLAQLSLHYRFLIWGCIKEHPTFKRDGMRLRGWYTEFSLVKKLHKHSQIWFLIWPLWYTLKNFLKNWCCLFSAVTSVWRIFNYFPLNTW